MTQAWLFLINKLSNNCEEICICLSESSNLLISLINYLKIYFNKINFKEKYSLEIINQKLIIEIFSNLLGF